MAYMGIMEKRMETTVMGYNGVYIAPNIIIPIKTNSPI